MKFIIKVLAKKVRRVRALVDVMEEFGGPPYSAYYRDKKGELEALKGILGLMIKKELDKS